MAHPLNLTLLRYFKGYMNPSDKFVHCHQDGYSNKLLKSRILFYKWTVLENLLYCFIDKSRFVLRGWRRCSFLKTLIHLRTSGYSLLCSGIKNKWQDLLICHLRIIEDYCVTCVSISFHFLFLIDLYIFFISL